MLRLCHYTAVLQSNRDRPLLAPKTSETERLSQQQQQDMERMKMFVQLRQDLERVRNLCYMVSRREKLSRSYFRLREQTFHKQVAVLSCADIQQTLLTSELNAVRHANHAPNIYDITYSRVETCSTNEEFERVIQLIASHSPVSTRIVRKNKNGLVSRLTAATDENPYKRSYVNGGESRRSRSLSSISSESLASDSEAHNRWRTQVRKHFFSSQPELSVMVKLHYCKNGLSI